VAEDLHLPDIHEAAALKLREVEQLYTSGRRELVELLVSLARPVTMAELQEAKPALNQSSVYRNLTVLEEVGVVQKVAGAGDRALFELAEDLIGHHHHLICTACGRVDDFVVPHDSELNLDALLDRVAEAAGFRADGHRLDLLGTCSSCASVVPV
jgi:Fur family transcriptional regulator, ferric uptake regulator